MSSLAVSLSAAASVPSHQVHSLSPAAAKARDWGRRLARYRQPRVGRAIFELAVTLVSFVACWAAMAWAVIAGHGWLILLLLLPAALLVVRLFAIQHDCGHGSFFPSAAANDWTGRILGAFTLTPYDYWRRSHAIHHATSGNLDARGIGDVDTLTVREYQARSRWGRFCYRVYRNPFVLFGVGPAYLFVLQYRLPIGAMRRAEPWVSTMGTNALMILIVVALICSLGWAVFLFVQVPVTLVAASLGVWLFYVQHQFEETHWAADDAWSLHEAALHGSSHYELPPVLRWFTANLGVHHVHHLVSRIPSYRLDEVLRDHPELRSVGRLTLWQSFRCVRLVLWDESRGRLVSFAEARVPA
jgi:acyl-lipid omega-6 desaturase (Delta-12 desaturase)